MSFNCVVDHRGIFLLFSTLQQGVEFGVVILKANYSEASGIDSMSLAKRKVQ